MNNCKCPAWIKFLGKIFGQNKTAIDSLQKILSHAKNGHKDKLPYVIFLKEQNILNECGTVINKITRSEKKVFYNQYRQWCESNGKPILARNRFYAVLMRQGIIFSG